MGVWWGRGDRGSYETLIKADLLRFTMWRSNQELGGSEGRNTCQGMGAYPPFLRHWHAASVGPQLTRALACVLTGESPDLGKRDDWQKQAPKSPERKQRVPFHRARSVTGADWAHKAGMEDLVRSLLVQLVGGQGSGFPGCTWGANLRIPSSIP